MRHGSKLFQNPVTHIRLLRLVSVCVCVCLYSISLCLFICVRSEQCRTCGCGCVRVRRSVLVGHFAQCSGKDVKNTWL